MLVRKCLKVPNTSTLLVCSKVDRYKTNNGDKNSKTSLLDLMDPKIELKGVPFFCLVNFVMLAGHTHTHLIFSNESKGVFVKHFYSDY
jgi:hypothetical protein